MSDGSVLLLFQKKLKNYLIALGLSPTVAKKISEQTSFKVNAKGLTEILCQDDFYLDEIINPNKEDIFNLLEKEEDISNQSHKNNLIESKSSLPTPVGLATSEDQSFVLHSGNSGIHFIFQELKNKKGSSLNDFTFIYGGTGLGKTNSLKEICKIIKENYQDKTVLYITANDFVYDIVHRGIRSGKMQEVRKKYISCDFLCFDDVQFLQKKDACQAEFFSIFSHLRDRKKTIFMSSNIHPKEMKNMDERLKGRFLQGTMIYLEPPSLEDKKTLFESKCREAKIVINKTQIDYICSKISSNICEIDGMIKEILFHKKNKSKLDDDSISTLVLKNRCPEDVAKRTLSLETIKKTVSEFFQIKPSELVGLSREKRFVQARHIAMYLVREYLNLSILEIAHAFKRANHTTVLHAIKKIKNQSKTDKETTNFLSTIKSKLDYL